MGEGSREKISDAFRLAEKTEAFTERELAVLAEVLEDCLLNLEEGYRFEEIAQEGNLSGFLIWGRTPMTEKGYDIYWIAVDPILQGGGCGSRRNGRLHPSP
jgi:ribosomal protein S18 acetylase RimI-like enzyme